MYGLGKELVFPHPSQADEQGLLAVGGDLSSERLILAYRNGIFPWYSDGQPILWWSPDPRMILLPKDLHVSRSMKQVLARGTFTITMNEAFDEVIERCASIPRSGQEGTWITEEMKEAYCELHRQGVATSVEVREQGELVGGLYGLKIDKAFFGESMFSDRSNASKAGFIHLVEQLKKDGVIVIDCQVETEHLKSLGARTVSRNSFLEVLKISQIKD